MNIFFKEESMYELRLDIPVGFFQTYDLETKKTDAENLQKITSFRKKLIYFNENIKSLSLYNSASKIFIEWGRPGQILVIYDGSKKGRTLPEFDSNNEEVFLEVRSKEVERLKNGINEQVGYHAKLSFLFATKGYRPEGQLSIYPNIEFSNGINPDLELMHAKPVIDLEPEDKEQIRIYNAFIKDLFDKKYVNQGGFSESYKCFNFEKEKQKFENAASVAVVPQKLVDYLKDKIEKHYRYPEILEDKYKDSVYGKYLSNRIEEESGLITNLFSKKMVGSPIDLNKNKLTEYALLDYTNVSEIVKYYRYILNWREGKPKEVASSEITVPYKFKNNFNAISEEDIYNYFKKELVDKNHLTEAKLNDYLFMAFDRQELPVKKFTIQKLATIQKIIDVFYKFYKVISVKPYGKQRKYAALLGDYFEGFNTNTVASNFSK